MLRFKVLRSERHGVTYIVEAASEDDVYDMEDEDFEDLEPIDDLLVGTDIVDVEELGDSALLSVDDELSERISRNWGR